MNTTLSSASGWRLAIAAGALAALTVGCGTDVQPPTTDIGDRAPAPTVLADPEVPEAPAPAVGSRRNCAKWPSEARAEHRTLCR